MLGLRGNESQKWLVYIFVLTGCILMKGDTQTILLPDNKGLPSIESVSSLSARVADP